MLLGAVFTHRAHKRKASEHVVVAWAVLTRWASVEAMLAAGCGRAHCCCDLCAQAQALHSLSAAGHAPSRVAPGPVRWLVDVGAVAAWLQQCRRAGGEGAMCDAMGIPVHPRGVDAAVVAARRRLITAVLDAVRRNV